MGGRVVSQLAIVVDVVAAAAAVVPVAFPSTTTKERESVPIPFHLEAS